MKSNKKAQFTTAHELLKNPHLQSKTSKNIEIDKAISFYQKKSHVQAVRFSNDISRCNIILIFSRKIKL